MAHQSYPADSILVDLADNDAAWGPLLFLRPKTTQYLGLWRLAVLACVIGGFQGMAVNFGMVAASRLTGQALVPACVAPIVLSAALIIALNSSVGRAWNRRADRLQRR
jgi:hypothetical protein